MCSLQEAYQIPSFASVSKKRCAPTVVSSMDPFSPEMGRGEKARVLTEGFTGSQDAAPRQLGMRDTVSYAAQATDNDYYCRTYGVCTTPDKKPIPVPNPDVPTTGRLEGFTADGTCKYGSDSRPLRYEYPMSPEAKAAYDKAVKLSLSSDLQATATTPVEAQMRTADMSQVKGFEDEDLDKYLQTKDMKAAPLISTPAPLISEKSSDALPYDPKESPFAKAIQHFSKEENKVPLVLKENMAAPSPAAAAQPTLLPSSNDKLWDLLLLVLAGVLIIFLCDQLFRLGVMMGMKKTVQLLEPFLEKA